jgi:hypothetical protein
VCAVYLSVSLIVSVYFTNVFGSEPAGTKLRADRQNCLVDLSQMFCEFLSKLLVEESPWLLQVRRFICPFETAC